jgi:NADPH:quinone reductase-like Zn-dependent oxidoreductase
VLVHLAAAGINRLDIWVRNGWPGIKLQYPHILGADGAGQVLGCGEFAKHLSIIGSTMGTRQDFSTVMDLVFTGKLQVALDSTFPLEEARRAHEYLEKGFQRGKLTLEIPS